MASTPGYGNEKFEVVMRDLVPPDVPSGSIVITMNEVLSH